MPSSWGGSPHSHFSSLDHGLTQLLCWKAKPTNGCSPLFSAALSVVINCMRKDNQQCCLDDFTGGAFSLIIHDLPGSSKTNAEIEARCETQSAETLKFLDMEALWYCCSVSGFDLFFFSLFSFSFPLFPFFCIWNQTAHIGTLHQTLWGPLVSKISGTFANQEYISLILFPEKINYRANWKLLTSSMWLFVFFLFLRICV